jgi:two-component system, OmpR family, response regulator
LSSDFDMIMLDLRLPGTDGAEVLERVVKARPDQRVFVLSALPEISTRVACLEAGATDFLAKPFAIAELVARVRTRMRTPPPGAQRRWLTVGAISLDLQLHRVVVAGRQVALSHREYLLLRYLMERVGRACTRWELLADVWGTTFDPGSNVVDVYVRRLRRKLDDPERVETVRNVGYRFVAA